MPKSQLDKYQNTDLCRCGKRAEHLVILENNEVEGRYCHECFIERLKTRFAAGLAVAPGWIKYLGLEKA